MMNNGLRSRPLLRRIQRYRKYMDHPALQSNPVVQQYREQVIAASSAPAGRAQYVPGDDVRGDALREFSNTPV
eukprot:4526891-Heterocapsa_arctica.AAC.1